MLQFSISFFINWLNIFYIFEKSDRKEESSGSRNDVWIFSKIVVFVSSASEILSEKNSLHVFRHTLYIFRNQNVNRLPLALPT